MVPFAPNEKILEVGGGDQPLFRPNLDVRVLPTVDYVCDLANPWPVGNGEFDGAFSKFAMEHVSWRKIRHFVSELFRVIRPGGTAYIIIPNTEAQMRWALEQGDDWEKISQCLFGDQNYGENAHAVGFNPAFAIRLFREAGFEDIAVTPFGELKTDMCIEARKPMPPIPGTPTPVSAPDSWTTQERKQAYNRFYFDGGRGPVGGYSHEGYRDFPVHHLTHEKIMGWKPESVIEIGAARGYVLKRLEDAGIRVQGIEISHHCYLTRVVESILEWDVTQTPWPFKDKEFDLAFSCAVLEHIPENKIDAVVSEIRRVSRRGMHGVDFGQHDDGFDKTHCLFRPREWWTQKLNAGSSENIQFVGDKEDLEKGSIPLPPADGKMKLNLGSFTTMFHHGWINIDQHALDAWAGANGFIYHRHDLLSGIPFPDATIDLVYASHFLEHFDSAKGLAILRECHRVMKPGAVMRLAVPDAKLLAEKYLAGTLGDYDEISDGCANASSQAAKFWSLLFSGHSASYDFEAISTILRAAGFTSFEKCLFRGSVSPQMLRETIDLFPSMSLFVDVVKT